MSLAPACLAAIALLLPETAQSRAGNSRGSGVKVAQAQRQLAPGRAAPPPAAPPAAAPPVMAAPPAPPSGAGAAMGPAPFRAAPAPLPGGTAVGHPTAPAPPPGTPYRPPGYYYGPGWYPYYPYYVSPWAYSAYLSAPWWWGWGWGYGYYPVYPAPPPPPGEAPPARRINAEVTIAGGPTDQRAFGDPTRRIGNGSSIGFSARVESRDFGVHAGYDAFSTDGQVNLGSSTALEYFTAHFAWPVLAGQSGRVRLEGGVSVLAWPATISYAATTAVGPDAGVSGELALLGPLGVVGHARVSPWPRTATDYYAAAAIHLGPAAITGGWRDLRADGGGTAADLRFAGPQFGLALLF